MATAQLRRSPDDLSLRGRRKRRPQISLELLQPVERRSAAVLKLRDQRPGRLAVLLGPHSFRLLESVRRWKRRLVPAKDPSCTP
jgi:hypothetical protein